MHHLSSLNHVTTTTGHNVASPRRQVRDDVVEALKEWLASGKPLRAGGDKSGPTSAPIPGSPNIEALIDPQGECLVVSLRYNGMPCLTFAVVPKGQNGAALWRSLDGRGAPPKTPWCGVMLDLGLLFLPWLTRRCSATSNVASHGHGLNGIKSEFRSMPCDRPDRSRLGNLCKTLTTAVA